MPFAFGVLRHGEPHEVFEFHWLRRDGVHLVLLQEWHDVQYVEHYTVRCANWPTQAWHLFRYIEW